MKSGLTGIQDANILDRTRLSYMCADSRDIVGPMGPIEETESFFLG